MQVHSCPICGKKMVGEARASEGKYFPFCSERCQQIDLGHWFNGEYMIPGGSPEEPQEEESQEQET